MPERRVPTAVGDLSVYRHVRAELRALESTLARTAARLGDDWRPYDVDSLILDWDRCPAALRDERCLVEDWIHFLLVRDVLDVFMAEATQPTREYLQTLVGPGDEEYRAATTEDAIGGSRFVSGDAVGWWWHRLPTSPGAEIRRILGTGGRDRLPR